MLSEAGRDIRVNNWGIHIQKEKKNQKHKEKYPVSRFQIFILKLSILASRLIPVADEIDLISVDL